MITRRHLGWRLSLFVIMVLLSACATRPAALPFASGLTQPRGMAFDLEDNLFVVEAGARATPTSDATPAGTNHSGRVLRISPDRQVTTVMDGLPFTYYAGIGDTGVADVAFVDDQLYVLTGEGYDDQLSRAVLRPTPQGAPQIVASILNFAIGMSTSQELQIGYVVSNPYAMAAGDDGALYVSDGASGRVLRVTLDGTIRVFAELPTMPLAGMAFGPDGRLYVAMFSFRPHEQGSGAIWAADHSGQLSVAVENLTMPIDVAFDASGAMYILEFGNSRHTDQLYAPNGGRLLRIAEDGTRTIVLDRLNYPTAMAFSPTNDLYVAVGGAFTTAGQGKILKATCRSLSVSAVCPRAPAQ